MTLRALLVLANQTRAELLFALVDVMVDCCIGSAIIDRKTASRPTRTIRGLELMFARTRGYGYALYLKQGMQTLMPDPLVLILSAGAVVNKSCRMHLDGISQVPSIRTSPCQQSSSCRPDLRSEDPE